MVKTDMNLYSLQNKDIEKALDVLVEAFIEYPFPGGIIKCIKRRRIALRELFKFEVKRCIKRGKVLALEEDLREVSVWKDDLAMVSEWGYIPYISWSSLRLLTSITYAETKKIRRITDKIVAIKKKLDFRENTAELYIVGVHPDYAGQGRAGKIIRAMLESYSNKGRDCLVMTNNDTNKKIYEKLGFVTVEDRMIEDVRIIYLLHRAI